MHYAKNECADALMHGPKSIGLAQAFMLLAMYHNPAKRFEEERAYLYAGLATRYIHMNSHLVTHAHRLIQDRHRLEPAHPAHNEAEPNGEGRARSIGQVAPLDDLL